MTAGSPADLVWLGSLIRAKTSLTASQILETGPEIQHTRSWVPGYCSCPRENLMVVCVRSISSAMVAPALPMIIPGTTEGTRNLTNASSSGVERGREIEGGGGGIEGGGGEGEGRGRGGGEEGETELLTSGHMCRCTCTMYVKRCIYECVCVVCVCVCKCIIL